MEKKKIIKNMKKTIVTIKFETPYYRAYSKKGEVVAEHLCKNSSGLRKLVQKLRGKVDFIDWEKSGVENPYIR